MKQLKIINLNVWIGGKLFDPMLDFLNNEKADIVLLQEVYNSQDPSLERRYRTFEVLKEQLGYEYGAFAPAFLEEMGEQSFEQGNAILSVFPLTEVSTTWYDVPYGTRIDDWEHFHVTPRCLQHVVADIDGKSFHLLNTQGIWGEDGGDNERRLKMAEQIVTEVSDHSPLLLAGDFNVRYQTEAIAKIEKKLTNVFKDDVKTTFNLKQKDLEKFPGFADAAVDGIFVTPDIKIIEKRVPDVDVSDHMPMVVEVEILKSTTY